MSASFVFFFFFFSISGIFLSFPSPFPFYFPSLPTSTTKQGKRFFFNFPFLSISFLNNQTEPKVPEFVLWFLSFPLFSLINLIPSPQIEGQDSRFRFVANPGLDSGIVQVCSRSRLVIWALFRFRFQFPAISPSKSAGSGHFQVNFSRIEK